jgi:ABC-2 type transport system ATP-binding protein
MDKFILQAKNLKITQGKFCISDVSFDLTNGDIMGLIGRSGSGKSTIINALLGIIKIDSGDMCFSINDKPANLKEHVGYAPQQNSLYPFLSIEENLITFGKLNRVARSDIDERMEKILKRLNLYEHRKKRINQLSGGMQKRADLAATLIHSPSIIILDEPYNGLDISMQQFIWSLLKELSNEGKIIIVSSHLLHDIRKNCNQFGLAHGGSYYNTTQMAATLKGTDSNNFEALFQSIFERDYNER